MTHQSTSTVDAITTLTAIEASNDNAQLPERIHLLRAGRFNTKKYGVLNIEASDLKEMVDNFKKGIGLSFDGSMGAPVNFAHQVGLEAAAWIKGLEFDGRNLWGTNIEWSTSGEKAIKGKLFKCFSSEFSPRCLGSWSNPENADEKAVNVFTGGALTNIPMFTGNRPVMASATSDDTEDDDKQTIYISASDKEIIHMPTLDEVRVKASVADLTDEEKALLVSSKDELNDDEKKKFGFAVQASTEVIVEKEEAVVMATSEVKGDEGNILVSASDVKVMADRIVELENEKTAQREADVKASVTKHIERGAVKADQLDKWVNLIMADASNEDLLKGINDNSVVASTEVGGTGADATVSASEQIMAKANALVAADATLQIGDAISKVRRENPELASEADNRN